MPPGWTIDSRGDILINGVAPERMTSRQSRSLTLSTVAAAIMVACILVGSLVQDGWIHSAAIGGIMLFGVAFIYLLLGSFTAKQRKGGVKLFLGLLAIALLFQAILFSAAFLAT